jgi:hypothetical protein
VGTITRRGPTVLITSTVNRIRSEQLDSRTLAVDIPDNIDQVLAALNAQSDLEEAITLPEPNAAIVAFHRYLQALAPIPVVVPFDRAFRNLLALTRTDDRLLRDASRLISLIKAVAILRCEHRQRDGQGRLIATIEDYQAMCEMVSSSYESTTSGVSPAVRRVVEAVAELGYFPSYTQIARHLRVHVSSVSRTARKAEQQGWLRNTGLGGFGNEARLELMPGRPLPDQCGLPRAENLLTYVHRVAVRD